MTELIGTATIMPFMALAADSSLIVNNRYFSGIYIFLGEPDPGSFLVMIGLIFIALMFISNGLLLLSQFFMNRYSFRLGSEISAKLYNYYLMRDVNFHQRTNSSFLIQRVMRDSQALSSFLVAPALKLNARIFSSILLMALLLYIDFIVALSSLAVLGGVYFFVFKIVRKKIYHNGLRKSELDRTCNRLLNESLEGIKELKLYGITYRFLDQFRLAMKKSTRASADNLILGESPYYLVETIVLSSVVLITLYFLSFKGDLEAMLPLLTLYCMTGLKLVPKIQQSYLAITRIKSAQAVFKRMYDDLLAANSVDFVTRSESGDMIVPRQTISLTNLKYGYPDGEILFDCLSLQIKANKTTAIVGSSGIGKSTLLELLMGLLESDIGTIEIDGEPIVQSQLERWRRSVGYVPQSVYLSDASIAENIAFGIDKHEIVWERVKKVAKIANIDNFIESLPDQYDTTIGERGGQLSGGQKQRLGIARALYQQTSVLILDEATSALDDASQIEVMNNLKMIHPPLTIIMATHRKETLSYADEILDLNFLNLE